MLRDKRTLYYSVIVYRDAESDVYVAASAFKMRYPGDYEGWPVAAGDTPQKAADNLAEAIRTLPACGVASARFTCSVTRTRPRSTPRPGKRSRGGLTTYDSRCCRIQLP